MKLSFEQGIAAGVAGLVATALVAGVLLVDHSAIAAPAEPTAQLQALPAPSGDAAFRDDASHASVVFAGGCFWGVQGVFQHVKGVSNAVSGYIGGSAADARYERVSGGRTGHAEAVKVDYDPRQVSYGQLMQVFFSVVHDPTQQPPGARSWQPVPLGDLRRRRAPAGSKPCVHRPARPGRELPRADRDPGEQRPALLPGRELPPELHEQLPAGRVHPLLRRAQADRAGQAVPGVVPPRSRVGADALTPHGGAGRWPPPRHEKDARPQGRALGKYRPGPDQARPTTTC